MLTTKEAIEKRRSIRSFKNDPVPAEHVIELIESARLAPSGCNAQPWRFKIVTDPQIRERLAEAGHNQKFIREAPVVLVCCADIKGYCSGTVSGIQDLGKNDTVEKRIVDMLTSSVEGAGTTEMEDFKPKIALNIAIAIEHIVLRALDYGLGTCWVRLFEEEKVKEIFKWNDNVYVVALIPLGYPNENPDPRKRMPLKDILID